MGPLQIHGGVTDTIQEKLALVGVFADIWVVLSRL